MARADERHGFLASDQDGFRDVDSESLQLMSVRLVLLGWHKSKDSDKD
ncbi:hypothetical protein HUE67_06815 [Bifidobacterium longum subsp. infantis]|uniref:Uncharacterized protein n=1 Tax=Bifidobacterium longum subsp. infantis TaxID=1682 RepID=A0A7D4XVE4_BIFLI|nr:MULTISPECIES: hypothetical protein [Bifidobacterium]NQX50735.1 hypothetical protein [Bifidobacterium longum subsp. infantis]QKY12424.1 hypothetical protein EE567_005960 [Bifidobacterium longum subsp. infantis]UPT01690.1 hypothetical protein HUE63_11045 [Bifidobacterium longum subsp. infantis]UPT03763.1 hypothetical protein HUE62_08560 [Bifidobacterium longum subsp. infantis]UPT05852.1 hypothetical protein HUE61_11120 [Bifidobacterium longum subsp. infantis]